MKRTLSLFISLLFVLIAFADGGYNEQMRDEILAQITGAQVQTSYVMSIEKFGAKALSDGMAAEPNKGSKYDCKKAFDKAMTAAAKKGGARIVVPAGVWYVCGPVNFQSNVTLELQKGATLKFSPNPDYYPQVLTSWEGTMLYNLSPFIYGYKLHDVAIVGEGTIDGNAMTTFATWRSLQEKAKAQTRLQNHNEVPLAERKYTKDDYLRPPMIQFFDCKNITMQGVMITNSPFWCVHLLHSENIICRSLRYNAFLINNDGIDPEYSRNVLIEDVWFNNGDDNVAIKAGRDNDGWAHADTPSENIIIRNCHFKGLHAVVLGSEMSAGVRNVFVEDCDYAGYCKRGIYIKTNPDRGGYVKNLYARNCKFDAVEDLFYITTMYAGEGLNSPYPSLIENINVENISCNKVSAAAIVVQGTKARPVKGVTIKGFEVGEAKNAISLDNCEPVKMQDVHIGGHAGAPSQVTDDLKK